MKRLLSLAGLAIIVMMASSGATFAQYPHPHYLHALSDLRLARHLLNRPDEMNVAVHQMRATELVNKAIGEINRASINDGVDPRAYLPPPADARLDQRGRLTKVRSLLAAASRDLRFEEDNMAALGWRNMAIRHVEQARAEVEQAMVAKRWNNQMRY